MQYMTEAEVAELIRRPRETVRYWRHKDQGPRWFKLGRSVLYDRADVEAWIEAQRAKSVR